MLPAGSAKACPQAGMTLLEVLVVVTILGLAAAALPLSTFSSIDSARFQALAKAMEAELGRTRARALATGMQQTFVLDVEERSFGSLSEQSVPEAVSVRFFGAKRPGLPASAGAIIFYPDGSASGGTIALAKDGKARQITVDWLTGVVRQDG